MTLQLGKKMIEIDMEHGRLDKNIFGTNLTVARTGKRITAVGFSDTDGTFHPYPGAGCSTYLYVPGYNENHLAALANLMRIAAMLLKDKVNELVGTTDRDFVNGGTYSTGHHVEEAIIYTPAFGYAGVFDFQAIFTFAPAYTEATYRKAKTTLHQGEVKYIQGFRLTESYSPSYFDSMLGVVDVQLMPKWDMEWVSKFFPEHSRVAEEAVYALQVQFGDFMKYIDGVAHLIKAYYYEGKSYDEYRLSLRQYTVNNVDLSKCGLYMDIHTVEQYYVYPGRHSEEVSMYHTTDETGDSDRFMSIKELPDKMQHIEGRHFNPRIK